MELTHMPMVLTTERDLLKLSQRLMLMLTMDTTDMPDLMPMVTDHMDTQLMVTTERDLLMLKPRLTQLSSTPVLSQLFTPSSAPHSSLPCPQLPPSRLSIPQSPTPTLSPPLLLPMLVSTLSTPQLSTQLDPQSTMERERPRLIQLSSTPTLSQLSTLLSEPTLLSDPHLSTTHMPSQLSLRPLSPPSPLPRPLTTVLSELMPDSSTPPTPESASTTLESRSHAKCAINLETDVQ